MLVKKIQPINVSKGSNLGMLNRAVSKRANGLKEIVLTPRTLEAINNSRKMHVEIARDSGSSTDNCDSSYHGPNCASPDFCW